MIIVRSQKGISAPCRELHGITAVMGSVADLWRYQVRIVKGKCNCHRLGTVKTQRVKRMLGSNDNLSWITIVPALAVKSQGMMR
jgi:hypothetical protein